MSDNKELRQSRIKDQAHATRAQDSAHPDARVEEEESWMQPANLDAPTPRDGMGQRFVRFRNGSDEDLNNLNKAFREGWAPRQIDTFPKDWSIPRSADKGRFEGGYVVADSILCEMPLERLRKRERFINARSDRLNEAVNRDLMKQVPAHVLQLNQRRSEVQIPTRAPSRVPPVADDE